MEAQKKPQIPCAGFAAIVFCQYAWSTQMKLNDTEGNLQVLSAITGVLIIVESACILTKYSR